jgi:hypothetical protein
MPTMVRARGQVDDSGESMTAENHVGLLFLPRLKRVEQANREYREDEAVPHAKTAKRPANCQRRILRCCKFWSTRRASWSPVRVTPSPSRRSASNRPQHQAGPADKATGWPRRQPAGGDPQGRHEAGTSPRAAYEQMSDSLLANRPGSSHSHSLQRQSTSRRRRLLCCVRAGTGQFGDGS